MVSGKKRVIRWTADITLIILSTVVMGLMVRIRPVRRGFHCGDPSLSYPYRPNTVTATTLLCGATLLPLALFILVELWRAVVQRHERCAASVLQQQQKQHIQQLGLSDQPLKQLNGTGSAPSFCCAAVRRCCCAVLRLVAYYWFGLMLTLIGTEVGKLGVGRLRPHFFSVCGPDLANCTQPGQFVEDFRCLNNATSRSILGQVNKSFPSGHSSVAIYVAVFLVMYIHGRLHAVTLQWSALFKPLLELCILLAGLYTCLSRVTDHWHHPGDVIGGAALGGTVAVWMIMYHSQHQALSYSSDKQQPPAITFVGHSSTNEQQDQWCQGHRNQSIMDEPGSSIV